MTAKRSGYFFAASTASAFASGSQLAGGWISAASTPASSIFLQQLFGGGISKPFDAGRRSESPSSIRYAPGRR
jgi:hypothetical protein